MKPCPNCGEVVGVEVFTTGTGVANVACLECGMEGPNFDDDGAKWDALPRREDVDTATESYADLWHREAEIAGEAESVAAYLAEWWRKIDATPEPFERYCECKKCKPQWTLLEQINGLQFHFRSVPDVAWVRPEKPIIAGMPICVNFSPKGRAT